MNNLTYNIINISDLKNIDFSQIYETSVNTIRKSLDESKFTIKYNIEPNFITNGTVKPLGTYNHSEILEILAGSDWSEPMPE